MDTSDEVPHQETYDIARHVSASGLTESNPGTLRKALNPQFSDRKVWLESYKEGEYKGLVSMDTMESLITSQYRNLKNDPESNPNYVCSHCEN
jgi:hypothetical protein